MSAAAQARSLRKGWCPGALRPMRTGDGLLVRLRVTGGIVPASLARAVAACARAFGNGLVDLSARANLQLRGVSEATLPPLTDRLRGLGLLDGDADKEARRNVMASPLAGLDPTALLDIRPLVATLERTLADNDHLAGLPPKFGVLVDDGGQPGLSRVAIDIGFTAVATPQGVRFAIRLGGDASTATSAGDCAPADLPETAVRIASAFNGLRGTGPDAPTRLAGLLAREGIEALRAAAGLREPAGPAFEDVRPDQLTLGLLPDGTTLGVGAAFGRWTADDLDELADAAERHGIGELRLTPWRAMLLPGIGPAAEKHVDAWRDRFLMDPRDPRLAVAACPGVPCCASASTDTHRDALALAGAARALAAPGVVVHVSGCPKGCAHPGPARVTFVARDGRYDVVYAGRAQDEPDLRSLAPAELAQAMAAVKTDRYA